MLNCFRLNYFQELDDLEFFTRFRLQKNTVRQLLQQIEGDIKSLTMRNNALLPSTKLLLTLRLYATGSMLIVGADFSGVSKTSACMAIKKVSESIARLKDRYIRMPRTIQERQELQRTFYNVARFPHVIGAIDCTHVKIQSPGGDNAELYRNRKGFFSWNVQTVCDAQLRILDIVARWPGSTHDQTIFNNSRIKARFENREMGDSLLLGDSGYGLTNYLITPLANPQTRIESLFNESQIRTRNVVERSYGVWKRRFPILSQGMRVSLERSKAIIVATAVLHNLAIAEKDGLPPYDPDIVQEDINNEQQPVDNVLVLDRRNNIRRGTLINTHFANL